MGGNSALPHRRNVPCDYEWESDVLRSLLALSGGLEILVGLLALISPASAVSFLLGGPMDSPVIVLTRLFGAGVFALGLACLKARHHAASSAGLAVSVGITSYNILV